MEQYIGPVLICLIPTIVSVILLQIIYRKCLQINKIKAMMFFLLSYFFIVSAIKVVLGERNKTLFESFWDIEKRTYVNYGIPLILVGVLFPIFLKWFFRDKISSLIERINSVLICSLFMVTYIFGEILNEVNCCIFIMGSLVALIWMLLEPEEYFRNEVIQKEKVLFSLKVIGFTVLSILIFNPSELFLSNINEFPFSYWSFLGVLITGGLIIIVAYVVITTYFLNNTCYTICNYMVFILTFVGYLQGMFFNGELLALDGTRQEWSAGKIVGNAILWALIIASVIILICLSKKVEKIIGAVCVYVSMIQLASLITLCATTEFPNAEETYALTTEGRFELHPSENVIVFILDWYDEQIIEKLVEENENFLEPLSDFTWYQNATSKYAYTDMSVPYLLTNVEWEYDMNEMEYCKYAYSTSHFLQDIAEQDYEIGIYTDAQYVDNAVKTFVRNYSNDIEQDCKFLDTIMFMSKCSKYKMAPFVAKNLYWYSTSEIISTMESSNVHLVDNHSFYQQLSQNGIKIASGDNSGVFRFYHLDGAHGPCTMTANFEKVESTGRMQQAEGSIKIVYEYIRQMKELGVYDNATIIITADHGQNVMIGDAEKAEEEGFEQTSNPIMFVKGQGQKQASISQAPVSHQEIAATVMKAINGNEEVYGKTFDDIKENETRDREFILRRHDDIPYRKYVISGDVRDWSNWMLLEDMRE